MSERIVAVRQKKPQTPVSLQLVDIASRRFVLVRGEWPARRGLEIIAALAPERVLVQVGEGTEAVYHLLPTDEAQNLFAASADSAVEAALASVGTPPTPVLDARTRAEDAPDRCVIFDEGELLGFFDVDAEVPDVQRGRPPDGREPEVLSRVLAAEMEREVELGQTVSLFVSLHDPAGAGDSGLQFALPQGSVVEVYVRPLAGFELAGPHKVRLVVTGEPGAGPEEFYLRAVATGDGRIEVLALARGNFLGRLVLTSLITGREISGQPVRHECELFPGSAADPDLTLLIQEIRDVQGTSLRLWLWSAESPDPMKEFGPIPLRLQPGQYFDDFFHDVEGLGGEDDRARETAVARLQRKGAELFQSLLPDELQALLWSLRQRIRSLCIESAEPWIPWEMCRLVGREGGRIVESDFLCEQFVTARWIFGIDRKPSLRLRRLGVIASSGSDLSGVADERRALLGLDKEDNLQVGSIPCRYLEILEALSAGIYDGIHFAGHGMFRGPNANRSSIALDDQETLTPGDLSGEVANLGRTWPLVFLNACQTARNSFSLTGLGGWAPKFLRADAAAFVGTLWEVSDRGAEIFARVFYRELFAGKPIGKAVRQARAGVRAELPGNPAWLAYTLFADPLARLV